MNFIVVSVFKESVTTKENEAEQVNTFRYKEMVKAILKNRNLMLLFCYTLLLMTAVMGRVGVMVYFYMYCVQNTAMMGILMIIPNIVGMVCFPMAPMLMKKFGEKESGAVRNYVWQYRIVYDVCRTLYKYSLYDCQQYFTLECIVWDHLAAGVF